MFACETGLRRGCDGAWVFEFVEGDAVFTVLGRMLSHLSCLSCYHGLGHPTIYFPRRRETHI